MGWGQVVGTNGRMGQMGARRWDQVVWGEARWKQGPDGGRRWGQM